MAQLANKGFNEDEKGRTVHVLVVGKAGAELSGTLKQAAVNVGQAIALADLCLITADYSGVDWEVANAYANVCRKMDQKFKVQLYLERKRPIRFVGGEVFYVQCASRVTIEKADLVIVLDGSNGVQRIVDLAREANKPIVALGNTGRVAQNAFQSVLADWDKHPIPRISQDRYRAMLSYVPDPDHLAALLCEIVGNVAPRDFVRLAKKAIQPSTPTNVEGGSSLPTTYERGAVFTFGVCFIIALLLLSIKFPEPTIFQYTVFRIILAVAASGVVAFVPGFIEVEVSKWIRAGGAIAVFVIVYFFSPASLVT